MPTSVNTVVQPAADPGTSTESSEQAFIDAQADLSLKWIHDASFKYAGRPAAFLCRNLTKKF